MKKALMPIVLFCGAILVLIAAMYVYERKWGVEGPFESEHTHGHGDADDGHHENDGHDHTH